MRLLLTLTPRTIPFVAGVISSSPVLAIGAVAAFLVSLVRVAGEEVAVLRSGVTGVRGRLFGPRLGDEGELDAGAGIGVFCSAAWARSLAMRCLIALAVQAGRGEC